jgi:hypothetical protein
MMSDHGSVCLKTGCLLEIAGECYWGDLHSLGARVLIFNAVQGSGEAVAVDRRCYAQDVESVCYDIPHFERRGVFVLLADLAHYSPSLLDHFERWGGPR